MEAKTYLDVATDWIDGRKFYQFLKDNGIRYSDIKEQENARIYKWKQGASISFHLADKVLTRLDLHLCDLPDDAYLDKDFSPTKRGQFGSPDRRNKSTGT
jgi:hypothetical protein